MSACAERAEYPVSTTGDPVALVDHLEESERFHRDSVVGRILHPGTISFRERVAENSMHIVIVGNQVSVHVDRYAPLAISGRGARYSLWRATAHNLAHLAEDVVRLLTGTRGAHRCQLECHHVETGDEVVDRLLTTTSACDTHVG